MKKKYFSSLLLLVASMSFAVGSAAKNDNLRFPLEVINRPGVLPTHIFQSTMGLNFRAPSDVLANVKFEYGVLQNLQTSLSFDGLAFREAKVGEKSLTLGGKYSMWGRHLAGPWGVSQSVALDLPFHFQRQFIYDITAGLPTVFYTDRMAMGVGHSLLHLSYKKYFEMDVPFKFWVGAQVYGKTWADLSSSFGRLSIVNTKGQGTFVGKGFWQELPLTLTVIHAMNPSFDVKAYGGFGDVLKAKQTFEVGFDMVVRGGRLFG